jgi:dTDP-4-amino-4,6-dideoxygalactose transaminase
MSSIADAMETKILTGDTIILKKCESLLETKYNFPKVSLTNSCTIALEMAALLFNIREGDEVIIPSYTYVSTANAFALRGARIIFADSRSDHPGIDEDKIEKLVTLNTKAIVVVHYAGVACNMEKIKKIASKFKLFIIEDAAQCIDSFYKGKPLGSIGDIGCFSFHETKNIHCGEGGFISINNPELFDRAEIIRNKGTNKSAFLKGEVNKYEWMNLGFSAVPSTLASAFLLSQLRNIDVVQKRRKNIWQYYYKRLDFLCSKGIALPAIPDYATNNAHLFYLVCRNMNERDLLIRYLKDNGIQSVFHYQALHQSHYFKKNYEGEELPEADRYSQCIIRLPLYFDLTETETGHICDKVIEFYKCSDVRD